MQQLLNLQSGLCELLCDAHVGLRSRARGRILDSQRPQGLLGRGTRGAVGGKCAFMTAQAKLDLFALCIGRNCELLRCPGRSAARLSTNASGMQLLALCRDLISRRNCWHTRPGRHRLPSAPVRGQLLLELKAFALCRRQLLLHLLCAHAGLLEDLVDALHVGQPNALRIVADATRRYRLLLQLLELRVSRKGTLLRELHCRLKLAHLGSCPACLLLRGLHCHVKLAHLGSCLPHLLL